MNKHLINAIFLAVGILFGIVLSIGIEYPLEIKNLDAVKTVCVGQTIKKIKINAAGKIKEVECENSTTFKLN